MSQTKLLLVDDEPNVLSSLTRTFRGEAYDLLTTSNASEALSKTETERPDIVISDYGLPDMNGVELLTRIRQQFPDIIRILLTGHADFSTAMEAINQGEVYRFITKPWNNDDLKTTVRQALRLRQLERQNAELLRTVNEQNAELRSFNTDLEKRVLEQTAEVRRLYGDLQGHFVQSVKVFVEMVSLRDANMADHCKRVAAFSKAIARQFGLDEQHVFELEIAAVLHDIGKIGMPDAVLDLNAPLAPNEKAMYREHPAAGQKVIQPIPELERAARLIRHHHERFDGRGFPDGLKRDDIPLGAKLISIADAFDRAMYGRKFGERLPLPEALEFIQRMRGYDFDPEIVDVFVGFVQNRQKQQLPQQIELKISLSDLTAGMVTAREVRTSSGILLVAKGECITEHNVRRLVNHDRVDPIISGIFVLSSPSG